MTGTALAAGALVSPRAVAAVTAADFPILEARTPVAPPEWALLERAVLDPHLPDFEAFFDRYFDERGFLLEHERWGGDDGPDDAIENVNDWPQLYALGASDRIRQMYEKAYEG